MSAEAATAPRRRNCKCRLCDEARRFGSRRPPRCATCGCHPTRYDEIWQGHEIQFISDPDSGVIEDEGILVDGTPRYVVAYCRACDRSWRLRGVQQITELAGYTERSP